MADIVLQPDDASHGQSTAETKKPDDHVLEIHDVHMTFNDILNRAKEKLEQARESAKEGNPNGQSS